MAQKWDAEVNAAVKAGRAAGGIQVFNFLDLLVSTPIRLTDYHDDFEVDGNTYTAGEFASMAPPPRSGKVTQDVQTILVAEALNSFTTSDFISRLGDYYGATVIARTFIVGVSGALLTGAGQTFMRSEGIIHHVYRPRGAMEVAIDVSNSYGRINTIKELRTTRGSLSRIDNTSTAFDRADAVTDQVAVEWGS
jgi:hypothetical protein